MKTPDVETIKLVLAICCVIVAALGLYCIYLIFKCYEVYQSTKRLAIIQSTVPVLTKDQVLLAVQERFADSGYNYMDMEEPPGQFVMVRRHWYGITPLGQYRDSSVDVLLIRPDRTVEVVGVNLENDLKL